MGTKRMMGTEQRAEARKIHGKQARLELLAQRRGIVPTKAEPEDAKMSGKGAESGGAATAVSDTGVDALAANAAKRALAFAPSSQRTFHKELATVLRESDVLLEVLDARDPMGCRCKPLEEAILTKFRSKRVVLVLNKVDLVPPDVVQKWLKYLRQYFPTLPFKASTQSGSGKRGGSSKSAAAGELGSYSTEAYGGEKLLQLLKNYSRSRGMKTAITVGIVGYPNVGKSSLINSLKRARAVNVGATPGVTTSAQTVAIDSKVKLMDCPGIVFARAATAEEQAEIILRNCVRVEKLDDPSIPIEGIMRKVAADDLKKLYGIGAFADATEFLTLVAAKRGHLRKGGAADHDAAARAVLQDWNAGVIRYYMQPPKPTGGVALVDCLADKFDWHAPDVKVETAEETDAAAALDLAAVATNEAEGGGAGSDQEEMDDSDEGRQQQLLTGWKQGELISKRLADLFAQSAFAPHSMCSVLVVVPLS
jgi:nuclear GTP-binding protein